MSQLDNVITCAVNYASDKNHEYVTLEHLMLCCLEEEAIIELLDNFECDVELTRQDLKNYLENKELINKIC